MDITLVPPSTVPSMTEGLDLVYRATFALPPWNEDADALASFAPRLATRAAGGFRLAAALDGPAVGC